MPKPRKKVIKKVRRAKRQKTALITGITGQDGSFMAEFLLKKGYKVAGLVRKTSHLHYPNIGHIQEHLNLIQGDLIDPVSIREAIQLVKPDEVYNFASQSVPRESFLQPIHTAEITAIGAQRVLDAVLDIVPKAKFYQASSSEMFGWVKEVPQDEDTPFNPANPYAISKLFVHHMVQIYRKGYKMFAVSGILFNHESPRRGLSFVTQKVAFAAACAKLGIRNSEYLNEEGEPIVKDGKVAMGNLDAKRDWGFAGDYVEAAWIMLQQKKPEDFVIGTGEVHSVKELCEEAFGCIGKDWKKHVSVDPRFVRPTETGPLVANFSKAKKILGWAPKVKFKQLVRMMVNANIARLK